MERARVIIRTSQKLQPEAVTMFEQQAGVELISATSVYAGTPDGFGNNDADGVELVFQGESSNINENALDIFHPSRVSIGTDITDQFK
jgi:hypothetical protein